MIIFQEFFFILQEKVFPYLNILVPDRFFPFVRFWFNNLSIECFFLPIGGLIFSGEKIQPYRDRRFAKYRGKRIGF